ncbi:OmpA family protein [Ferrimonas balearica]|uniref:OmpA family protein n=1 Tax=Ferrimonas balearica TaxID=44012 RepID=UPI001C99E5FA|nr:OmpA family protein [Ferrimonas balearica]MBY5920668.1 outer membrane beta-barrel protein [Ferrimonas balearica]MBY5996647.1 outer membrane beta-barrel protein [Ferrimonas balearica]
MALSQAQIIRIAAPLIFSLTASIASAADDLSYWYVGGKIGWSHFHNGCEAQAESCDKDSGGWGAQLGYRATEHWAFEAQYLDFGDAVATYRESGQLNQYTGSMAGWTVALKGILPLTKKTELYGKVGSLYWDGEVKGPGSTRQDNDWAPMMAIGLDYHFSPRWSISAETQYADGVGSESIGGSNLFFTSVGVQYRFGPTQPQPQQKPTPPPPPPPAPVVLPAMHSEVHFAFDSATPLDEPPLTAVVDRLVRYPDARVIVKGYADATGPDAYNMKLSERRAEAIKAELVRQGVNPDQITVEGFGEQNPVLDNETAEHRAQNRRVHLYLPGLEVNP